VTSSVATDTTGTPAVVISYTTAEDAGVTTSAVPSKAAAGYPALLSSTVANGGPAAGPITFTDNVPAGLAINSAAAGSGTCATSGQKVTCIITGLGAGQSAPVDIVVTPSGAGTFTSAASVVVAAPFTDPNAANNSASATLTASTVVAPRCVVPNLKGIKLQFANQVIFGCTAGPVRHAHNSSVAKGDVIRTSPGAGTYPAGEKITFVVSSGPKRKRHR
jgi:hypothetical protein